MTRRLGSPWTPDEDRALAAAARGGETVRRTARKLGRTVPAVGKRRRKLGLAGRRLTPAEVASIPRLCGELGSLAAVARHLGCHETAVGRWTRRMKRKGRMGHGAAAAAAD